VIALDESFAGVTLEGDVQVRPDALENPAEVVPERPLAFFARNRDRLQAAVAVHRAADLEPPCDLGPRGRPRAACRGRHGRGRRRTRPADDGGRRSRCGGERGRERRKRPPSGGDPRTGRDDRGLGPALAGRARGRRRLSPLAELADEYAAAVEAARDHLVDALDLDQGEAEIARRAFSDEPTFPVERDEDVISRVREELTAAKDRRAGKLKRELAADLADQRDGARQLVRDALELTSNSRLPASPRSTSV